MAPFLEESGAIPDKQHGFKAERSTKSACKSISNEMQKTLSKPKQSVLALFVDLKAAFDMGSQTLVLKKLAMSGVPYRALNLLKAILQTITIFVEDKVSRREVSDQITGPAQGDNLSPFCSRYSLMISPSKHSSVNVMLYPNDLVMFSGSRFHLQKAIAALVRYVKENRPSEK